MLKLKNFLKEIFPVAFLIVLSIGAILPLFHAGFFTFHDDQQVARLFELNNSLKTGQFPVRWVADLGFGYGYALFNFYPPLAYYVGEIFHLVGFGFIDSIKIVWGIALMGSGIAMYFLAKNLFGKLGGVVAALFYLYAPYHAVDAYVRGALAELFSFVWLPLILLSIYKKRPVFAGIFLGFLMVTHNLIFLPFFCFFAVWAFIFHKKSLVIAPLVAFGLTAFFWLPSLAEKQFTLVDQILLENLAAYKIHFVCLSQFWYSPWGFGGSAAGCTDGLSFMVGKIYLVAIGLGFLLGVWKKSLPLLVSFGLVLFAGFMTVGYSQFLWDKISPLWYLQFPWRFMEFIALFSAILAGGVVSLIPLNKWLKTVVAIIFVLGLIPNLKYFAPQSYLVVTDKDLTTSQEIKWHVSSTSFEYMPKGMATHLNEMGNVWVNIDKSQIATKNYTIISGRGVPLAEQFLPGKFIFEGVFDTASTIQFSTTYFPGWKLKVDGQETSIIYDNPYNLITVSVLPGVHKIAGEFTNTPVRILGNSISLITFGLLVILGCLKLWKMKK